MYGFDTIRARLAIERLFCNPNSRIPFGDTVGPSHWIFFVDSLNLVQLEAASIEQGIGGRKDAKSSLEENTEVALVKYCVKSSTLGTAEH